MADDLGSPQGGEALLRVEGLNQFYGGSHILRNLGFEARIGEVTVVLGRNGVGKTTLLKSLMGVVPVKTGSIKLAGADITRATSYERVRRGIGYVPQGREIFGRLTVEENLRMGLAVKPGGTPIPAELFELFLSLEGQHSLVVVEHDMKFVDQLTEGRKTVTVLHEGSVLAEGLLSDVQANEKVVEVYLGR